MKKFNRIFAVAMLSLLGILGVGQSAQAVTVIADPVVKSSWTGKWGPTCKYVEERISSTTTRLHEVRRLRIFGPDPCVYTGYYVDANSYGTARVIWWT